MKNNIYLKVVAKPGADIEDAVHDTHELSKKLGVAVELVFGGERIVIRPTDTDAMIEKKIDNYLEL